jgi:hypothetical protein
MTTSSELPPLLPAGSFVYSVKFLCGTQPECDCACTSVRPGKYATEANIHNFNDERAVVRKLFIPLHLAGAPVGREPKCGTKKGDDESITLLPQTASMVDCCRIVEKTLGAAPGGSLPLMIGIVEIICTEQLAVTAVYTATDVESHSIAIDVQQIAAHIRRKSEVPGHS